MGKKETVTSDLAKSLQEIYSHIGQTETSYTPWLILTGGDGLTYERMVQLKNYLQFHGDAYERLDILEPLLEIWHTKWTDLSRQTLVEFTRHTGIASPARTLQAWDTAQTRLNKRHPGTSRKLIFTHILNWHTWFLMPVYWTVGSRLNLDFLGEVTFTDAELELSCAEKMVTYSNSLRILLPRINYLQLMSYSRRLKHCTQRTVVPQLSTGQPAAATRTPDLEQNLRKVVYGDSLE
jgi:hypothetical protein